MCQQFTGIPGILQRHLAGECVARTISQSPLFVPGPRPAPGGLYRGHYAPLTRVQPGLPPAAPAGPGRWDEARRAGLGLLVLLAAFIVFAFAVVIM